MEKAEEVGAPPFEGLRRIIESAGYRVISIGAEYTGMRFTGAINLQIAPASWVEQTDFVSFPQIPQDFPANTRECAAQCCRQESSTD